MIFADVLGANEAYSARHQYGDLEAVAARGLAVLTCMDSRIDPLRMLGLSPGDAKILRNAGARVTDDVLRTLALADYLLGVDRVMVVAHTGCRMAAATRPTPPGDQGCRRTGHPQHRLPHHRRPGGGAAPGRAAGEVWPYLDNLAVGGFVFDLDTGRLRQSADQGYWSGAGDGLLGPDAGDLRAARRVCRRAARAQPAGRPDAAQALAAGEPTVDVWRAVCEGLEVPAAQR